MSREISRRSMLTVGAAAAATAAATSAVGGTAAASATEVTAASASGQPPWRPTPVSKPRFRYWWPGADVTPGQVTAEVNAIADAGFGGIEIGDVRNSEHEAMPATRYGWGTPAWKAALAAALRTAAARGLEADIYIGPYWPAVAAGIQPDDDSAMKELTYGQAILGGGATFSAAVPPPHSAPSGVAAGFPAVTVTPVLQAIHAARISGAATAAPLVIEQATLTDISGHAAGGTLTWTAPSGGSWVIIASWSRGTAMIEHQAYYEGWYYDFTDPRAFVVDHFGAAGANREVLAALDGAGPGSRPPAGDIRDVLSRELLRLRGTRVAPEDFDLDKLPPHLRITFRVTDDPAGAGGAEAATPKVLAAGKDLAALQRQLRPRLRATLSARAGALTRTGLTDWSFGELPRVFTDGDVRAYPALVDAGAAVDIRLFETAEAARAAMLAGTRRLILLGARSPVKDIAARLTTQQKLLLSNNPHGGVARLFEDCVNCAADSLIADAGGPAWDPDGFARLAESVRGGLHATTYEVVQWAEATLELAHGIGARLAGLRSPLLEPATADIREQLAGLAGPGYLTRAGRKRLPSVARYLRAIDRRLDKLAENPGRDAQLMAIVHGVTDEYQDALAGLPRAVRAGEDAQAIRWMIEELRVSLFAQTLGTPSPVSERRIRSAISRLR